MEMLEGENIGKVQVIVRMLQFPCKKSSQTWSSMQEGMDFENGS